jgi:hypothetical protein
MIDRRFDTRFFIAVAPEGQEARQDDHETTEALWLTPRQAIERYWQDGLPLVPVQLITLMQINRLERPEQAMQAASRRAPIQIQPEPQDVDGHRAATGMERPDPPGLPQRPIRTLRGRLAGFVGRRLGGSLTAQPTSFQISNNPYWAKKICISATSQGKP